MMCYKTYICTVRHWLEGGNKDRMKEKENIAEQNEREKMIAREKDSGWNY